MKNKELAEALGEVDQKYIAQAFKKRNIRRQLWMSVAAAVLVIAVLSSVLWNPIASFLQGTDHQEIQPPSGLRFSNLVATPIYPQMVAKPENENGFADPVRLYAWEKSQAEQYDQPAGYADSLSDFWIRSIPQFLSGQTENAVFSPVNVYMTLAMLAETADGNSRQQILDLLRAGAIEALRTQAGHVWNAHYCQDGATTSVLASSLWLDQEFTYSQEAVDRLAENYFASVFHGDLGTKSMNNQLRNWTNSQTGSFLEEGAETIELDPATVLALSSTIYFDADWTMPFSEENTNYDTFHGSQADSRIQFMKQVYKNETYYWGTDFGAARLGLSGGYNMWLILPHEDKTVADVLASGEFVRMCTGTWENQKQYNIKLIMPKFDISSQIDLVTVIKNMGVTDVFDPAISDFGGITEQENLYVGKIDHACRVAVDEEGCIAEAYTITELYYSFLPEEDEILLFLNRPFLFVITGRDGLPLFAGVVNQP